MSKREAAIKFFLTHIAALQPGNKNITMYKDHFAALSDDAFDSLMKKMAAGEVTLPYYSANLADEDVDIVSALSVGDRLGLDLFQQLWITDTVTGVKYLTPEKYFMVHLPVRRQIQHVTKGKSVTEHSAYTDVLTGQPVGDSKASRLSLPEIINLESLGLHKAIEELMSVRGGSEKAFQESKRSTLDTGEYSIEDVKKSGSRPTTVQTLHSFFKGMHYADNL